MTFSQIAAPLFIGQRIQYFAPIRKVQDRFFTIAGQAKNALQIRPVSGEMRSIRWNDFKVVIPNLNGIYQGTVKRGGLKTRNSTYAISIIEELKKQGYKF